MFSALRQNSPIYLLDKGREPSLRVGQVLSVTSPQPYTPVPATVDVTVSVDGRTVELKQLPSSLSIANHPSTGLVVAESREDMLREVEGMIRCSRQVLESVPRHERVVSEGDAMLRMLNPRLAREREREEKIGALEGKVTGIEASLGDIKAMLAQALDKK